MAFTIVALLVLVAASSSGVELATSDVDGLGTWAAVEKITPDEAQRGAQFGWSMAADGDALVAGDGGGSAFVFEERGDGWRQVASLEMDPRVEGEGKDGRIIEALAVDEDEGLAAVGIPGYDVDGETDAGAVEIYRRTADGWQPEQRLVGPVNGDENDAHWGNHGPYFGRSLDIDGDRLIVGTPETVADGERSVGTAFLYEYRSSDWVEIAELTDDDPAYDEHFGTAVALDGNRAAVTAVEERYAYDESMMEPDRLVGAVTVFHQSSSDVWIREAEFDASDGGHGGLAPVRDSCLGWDVDLRDETVVVGDPCAQRSPAVQRFHGQVYVLKRNTSEWTHEATLRAPEFLADSDFGRSVAIDGAGRIVVGDHFYPRWSDATGSAYLFEERKGAWQTVAKLQSNETSAGDRFGWQIAATQDSILVSAPGDTNRNNGLVYPIDDQDEVRIPPGTPTPGWKAGSVYLFEDLEEVITGSSR